jgi:hypothetical protein
MMPNGEFATDVAATAALTSPAWLPWLHTASAFSAMLLPVLGGTWLFVQITRALIQGWVAWQDYRKKKSRR